MNERRLTRWERLWCWLGFHVERGNYRVDGENQLVYFCCERCGRKIDV